ncbi:hypothetical protein AMATHDRAFT_63423 [Amanita thiersii Skay4041]|uniref:Uncharacterized protein n=1 Tax=Amanita thiersii Skay4041 TaxID=703135 RepID=A0A2A9NNV8_9AGAR|nr:hypothetical protein AMATHDRAFT_63423 [Amanita thiersii Skay4041]
MLTFAEGQVIATFVQAFLYGLYIDTFLHCVRWLAFTFEGWTRRKDIKWGLLAVTVFVFGVESTDVGLALQATLFSTLEKPPLTVANIWSYIFERLVIVIADCVLLHRCWITYGRKCTVVIIPALLWVGTIVCLILGIVYESIYSSVEEINRFTTADQVDMAFFALLIAVNIYLTSAILFRIWHTLQDGVEPSHNKLRLILHLFSESGLLFTITSIMAGVTIFIQSMSIISGNMFVRLLFTGINFVVAAITMNLLLILSAQSQLKAQLPDVQRARRDVPTLQFRVTTTVTSTGLSREQDTSGSSGLDAEQGQLKSESGSEKKNEIL